MIDLSKLQNVKKVPNGHTAQCPVCALVGHDHSKNNLFIGEKGFYCHRFPRDKEHNRMIWHLCGERSRRVVKSFHIRSQKLDSKCSQTVRSVCRDVLINNELQNSQTAQTVFSVIHAAVEQHLLINKEIILNKESEIHIKQEVVEIPSVASVGVENSSSSAKALSHRLTPPQNYLSAEMIEQGFRKITNWDELVAFAPLTASEIEPIKQMFDATLREAIVKREPPPA